MTVNSRDTHNGLTPLANAIIDRAIDNVARKLVAGHRNKKNSRPNAKHHDLQSDFKDALVTTSAQSVMDVANRGTAWKEMIQKTLSHGISSINTMKFDGEFTIKDGQHQNLDSVPNSPGVYVVFNKNNEAVYVGDSDKLKQRWHAGHLNEYKQGVRSGVPYKLAEELQEGCTVKFIQMESKTTAAALEAHLIKKESPKRNAREELATEQGTRSNQEAKKMKDASGSAGTLAMGAAKEAAANVGWGVFEQLATALIKALKDELVEVMQGVSRTIKFRLKRLFDRIWSVIQSIIDAPLKILSGIFEFVVNAVSQTIAQFYHLGKNIYELGISAWQLYQGAQTMNKDVLAEKVTETIILSGTLIIWDALDPVLETQLLPLVGTVAPYLSAAICAIGFGLSSFYLQKWVPDMVKMLLAMKTEAQEVAETIQFSFEKLITAQERELRLLDELKEHVEGAFLLETETRENTLALRQHKAIKSIDIKAMLELKK